MILVKLLSRKGLCPPFEYTGRKQQLDAAGYFTDVQPVEDISHIFSFWYYNGGSVVMCHAIDGGEKYIIGP